MLSLASGRCARHEATVEVNRVGFFLCPPLDGLANISPSWTLCFWLQVQVLSSVTLWFVFLSSGACSEETGPDSFAGAVRKPTGMPAAFGKSVLLGRSPVYDNTLIIIIFGVFA